MLIQMPPAQAALFRRWLDHYGARGPVERTNAFFNSRAGRTPPLFR